MPPRLEGKGSCTQGYGTGDLPDQGKKLRVSNPTRPRPVFVEAVSRRAPQGPSLGAANHNMSVYCYRGPPERQLLGVACRDLSVERQRPRGASSSGQRAVICQSSARGAPRGASSSGQRAIVCQIRRCACRRVPSSPRSSLTWSSLQCSCRTQSPQTASRRVDLEG